MLKETFFFVFVMALSFLAVQTAFAVGDSSNNSLSIMINNGQAQIVTVNQDKTGTIEISADLINKKVSISLEPGSQRKIILTSCADGTDKHVTASQPATCLNSSEHLRFKLADGDPAKNDESKSLSLEDKFVIAGVVVLYFFALAIGSFFC